MTNATTACRAKLAETVANVKEYIARGDITNAAYAAALPEYEAALAKFDAVNPDVDAVLAMDKAAIRAVPDDVFEAVKVGINNTSLGSAAFYAENSRRRGNATRAARAAEKASRAASGIVYTPGQQVEVHAMGYWYKGEVVRVTKTGSVVCRYTSGAGVTREKTVGEDKIRA
jgi:hypothetical protein